MTTRPHVIAVLDDDPVVRQAVGRLLTASGCGVELYGSAEEFLSVARSQATCLVIDVQLGDISGIELGRHLAANGFKFPIIFMTASDDDTLRDQALDFGCAAFLYKSRLREQLVEAVAKATASISGSNR
jgi:FixJ family two-component response regulator